MSWINLDDVYVNKSGDSIAGNLSVGGALTINNAKGTGGMYNVANEITALRDSVSQRGVVTLTTNLNDNVVQVKFNTPIETDYVVVTSLQFPKFETWGWPSVAEMVYNKTSTGFTMDVWNSHQEYQHIQCTINWIAIPLQYSVSQTNGKFKYGNDGYIFYSKTNDVLFITIINCYVNNGYTTLCTLPQGCRPSSQIVFAIANNVSANVHDARYGIIKENGEVMVKANVNGEYIWATTATMLNVTYQHSVSQIDFDIITNDTIKLNGIVVNGMALITVHWTNNAGFWSSAWGDTLLARIKGLKAVHELHSVFLDNTGDPANQSFRYLHVLDNRVFFRTAYGCNVPAGAWHMGHIAVPVTTVQHSVSQTKLLWSGSVYGGGSFVVPELKEYTFVEVVTSNADENHWGVLCFNDMNALKSTDDAYGMWVCSDIHAGLDYIVSIKSKLEIQKDLKTVKFAAGYAFNVMRENTTITSTQKLRIIAVYGVR